MPAVEYRVAFVSLRGHLIIIFVAKAVFLLLFLDLLRIVQVYVSSAWLRFRALSYGGWGLAKGLDAVKDTITLNTKLRNTSLEIQHL